jgi:hypothetical protein
MSDYTIHLPLGTNGTSLDVTVTAGGINSAYSLKLVGRGAPGYGQAFAENTLFTLNHNASVLAGAPTSPLIGQQWFNHDTHQMYVWVGTAAQPSSPGNSVPAGWAAVPNSATGWSGGTVQIAQGGTGATTGTQALINLGADSRYLQITGSQLTGYLDDTCTVNIAAAGSIQSTATALTTTFNHVATSTAVTAFGVKLPTASAGRKVYVINASANDINVFPASGAQIESLGSNVATNLGTGGRMLFLGVSSTQWYMLSAVYA